MLFGGLALLIIFVFVETKVAEPLFRISLFKIRAFAAGNIASLMLAMGRGGMQFMLIIWLQGIWLPLHGYSYSQTPLWAGIYLVPLTVGFLVAAPLSGVLSDKFGAKAFTVGGALLTGAAFLLLLFVPVNFPYWEFALVIALNGFGSGLFVSPNWAEMMNSVPADRRGAAGGMIATFQNSAFVLSIGIFFTLMVAGLSSKLPAAMTSGLTAQGVPAATAAPISHLPPIGVLFASFLGYNPMQQLLGPVLHTLPAGPRGLRGRPGLLPAPDHGAVPQRPRRGLRVRHRGQRDRRHRLGPDRPAPEGRPPPPSRWATNWPRRPAKAASSPADSSSPPPRKTPSKRPTPRHLVHRTSATLVSPNPSRRALHPANRRSFFRECGITPHNEAVWPPPWSRRKHILIWTPALGAALLGGAGWLLGPLWAVAGILVGSVAALAVLLVMLERSKPDPALLLRSGRPQDAYRHLQPELAFVRTLVIRRPMFREILADRLDDDGAGAAGSGQRAESAGDRDRGGGDLRRPERQGPRPVQQPPRATPSCGRQPCWRTWAATAKRSPPSNPPSGSTGALPSRTAAPTSRPSPPR